MLEIIAHLFNEELSSKERNFLEEHIWTQHSLRKCMLFLQKEEISSNKRIFFDRKVTEISMLERFQKSKKNFLQQEEISS